MKPITASILLLLMLMQAFSKWVIIIDYEVNKEFITKNLCLNKQKPQLHCNGKCQLLKKMSAEDKNPNPGEPTHVKAKFIELPIIYGYAIIDLPVFRKSFLSPFESRKTGVLNEVITPILRPPIV
jgi:hypothetical protein